MAGRTIQPGAGDGRDEELGAVGVGSGVGLVHYSVSFKMSH